MLLPTFYNVTFAPIVSLFNSNSTIHPTAEYRRSVLHNARRTRNTAVCRHCKLRLAKRFGTKIQIIEPQPLITCYLKVIIPPHTRSRCLTHTRALTRPHNGAAAAYRHRARPFCSKDLDIKRFNTQNRLRNTSKKN